MDKKIVKAEYERDDGKVLVIDNEHYMIPNDGITGVNTENWTIYSEELGNDEGSIVTGKSMSGRVFGLTFETADDNDSEREYIRAFFNLDKQFKATLTYRGVTRWVSGYVQVYDNPPGNVYKTQNIKIEMFCEDPFWKSVDDFGRDSANVIPRWGWPYQRTAEQNYLVGVYEFRQVLNLDNDGDTTANIVIDINFMSTVVEPKITDVNTGAFFLLTQSFSSSDRVHIDMKKGIVTLNGRKAHNRVHIDSQRLSIPVGGTTLVLSATSGESHIHAIVTYNQNYRGI